MEWEKNLERIEYKRWECRFHLGANNEGFGAETLAIYQALRAFDQQQESDRRYTVFVDSTSAITRVGDDALGPGQRYAVAAIEACSCILSRDNSVTIRWAPGTQWGRRQRGGGRVR